MAVASLSVSSSKETAYRKACSRQARTKAAGQQTINGRQMRKMAEALGNNLAPPLLYKWSTAAL